MPSTLKVRAMAGLASVSCFLALAALAYLRFPDLRGTVLFDIDGTDGWLEQAGEALRILFKIPAAAYIFTEKDEFFVTSDPSLLLVSTEDEAYATCDASLPLSALRAALPSLQALTDQLKPLGIEATPGVHTVRCYVN